MDLQVDVGGRRAIAELSFEPGAAGASCGFVADLELARVDHAGAKLPFRRDGDTLHLALPASSTLEQVRVEYVIPDVDLRLGWLANGSTLVWPDGCGRVFPCHPQPADGLTFQLELTGVPEGLTAVYPRQVQTQTPAYVVAWAVDEFTRIDLGATEAGTQIAAWVRPGEEAAAREGTATLRAGFEFFEQTYGAYAFGPEAGSVIVDWRGQAYGGMEHHPYWHVDVTELADQEVHLHEAAHGWFGDGVRIRCWEDFILSEGTTSYLSARAVEATSGPEAASRTWADFRDRLDRLQSGPHSKLAWFDGCNEHDVIADGLFRNAYMRGAFFLRAVEARVGRESLDAALRAVYQRHVGAAPAGVADLLTEIHTQSGYDPRPCANAWLRSETLPLSLDSC
ncbi:Membrane alanine aminopeptidase N [Enhygromyxa salina]|uniref:Membrane alanine aminopeptidase N n=2 Tax=Enhygromyxa salina TaxID=215803 RepID=A0A0C1ZMW7_9BACT|nr:Membrane alanine aminopeptidase N [Enhygromyxa salina]